MALTYAKPVQILCFLALVLFFLNFEFDEKYGNRGARTEKKFYRKIDEDRFLSSKLATTARLANHIFELASIYGMSQKLGRKPAIFVTDLKYRRLVEGINKVFPKLIEQFRIFQTAVPKEAEQFLLSDKCCTFDNPEKLENKTSKFLHLTGHFYQSWRYFDEFRDEIRGFVKEPRDFSPLPVSSDDNLIICVHIRRTDFVDGQHHASSPEFTKNAVEFIKNRENPSSKPVLTVIMGDDPAFEETIFPDTIRARKGATVLDTTKVFVSDNTPHDDLTYSRYHCDVALVTAPSSTFGWWLGYLSKGGKVYYQDIRSTNDVNYKKGELDPDDYFVPEWTSIKLENVTNQIQIV